MWLSQLARSEVLLAVVLKWCLERMFLMSKTMALAPLLLREYGVSLWNCPGPNLVARTLVDLQLADAAPSVRRHFLNFFLYVSMAWSSISVPSAVLVHGLTSGNMNVTAAAGKASRVALMRLFMPLVTGPHRPLRTKALPSSSPSLLAWGRSLFGTRMTAHWASGYCMCWLCM